VFNIQNTTQKPQEVITSVPASILPLHDPPSLVEDTLSAQQTKKKLPPYRSVGKYESFGADPAPTAYVIPSPKGSDKKMTTQLIQPAVKFQYNIRKPLMPLQNAHQNHLVNNTNTFGPIVQSCDQQSFQFSTIYSRSFQPY